MRSVQLPNERLGFVQPGANAACLASGGAGGLQWRQFGGEPAGFGGWKVDPSLPPVHTVAWGDLQNFSHFFTERIFDGLRQTV